MALPEDPARDPSVEGRRVRLPEGAKPQGKGVRAARTICRWKIVRLERTAPKRGAGGA